MDSSLLGGVLIACLVICLTYFLWSQAVPSAKNIRVLLVGPLNGGKSQLLHRLVFGAEPGQLHTIAGTKENVVRSQLHKSHPSSAFFTFVDFPGVSQLRQPLLRAAASARALVLVMDATAGAAHVTEAAGFLYDLLTCRTVLTARPSMLIVAHGRGTAGAAAMRSALEHELGRLRSSRDALTVERGGAHAQEGHVLADKSKSGSVDLGAAALDIAWEDGDDGARAWLRTL